MASSLDNRMGWIRQLEQTDGVADARVIECEIATEVHIPGILDYADGRILCGMETTEPDQKRLQYYLLKFTVPADNSTDAMERYQAATNKGYYFRGEVWEELLALFSLFFRCRFYPTSWMSGDLTSTSVKLKGMIPVVRRDCPKKIHPSIFPGYETERFGKVNFSLGLSDFLDRVRRLPPKYHQSYILAADNYHRAIKEVGLDREMIFIRLVSSIEALLKWIKLEPEDDLFQGKKLQEVVKNDTLTTDEMNELKVIFDARKTTKNFIRFIEKYAEDHHFPEKEAGNFTQITKSDLYGVLTNIYDARSRYLHHGEPMHLSEVLRDGIQYDRDPSFGGMKDNRRFDRDQILPSAVWFEGLVRHCLLKFLEDAAN